MVVDATEKFLSKAGLTINAALSKDGRVNLEERFSGFTPEQIAKARLRGVQARGKKK